MKELFFWQITALFWCAFCFFRQGAKTKGIPLSLETCIELLQIGFIIVLLFGLATDWRGCTPAHDVDAGIDRLAGLVHG